MRRSTACAAAEYGEGCCQARSHGSRQIRIDLPRQLGFDDPERRRAPRFRVAELGKDEREGRQSGGVSEEVVGGPFGELEVRRDVAGVLVQRAQDTEQPGRRERGALPDRLDRQRPRDRPLGHDQILGPGNAVEERVPDDPVVHLREQGLCIALVTGEPVRLGQLEEVRVLVQLPRQLDVADVVLILEVVRIESGVELLIIALGPGPSLEVRPPIDRIAEVGGPTTEHLHDVPTSQVGPAQGLLVGLGKAVRDQACQLLTVARSKERRREAARAVIVQQRGGVPLGDLRLETGSHALVGHACERPKLLAGLPVGLRPRPQPGRDRARHASEQSHLTEFRSTGSRPGTTRG